MSLVIRRFNNIRIGKHDVNWNLQTSNAIVRKQNIDNWRKWINEYMSFLRPGFQLKDEFATIPCRI